MSKQRMIINEATAKVKLVELERLGKLNLIDTA